MFKIYLISILFSIYNLTNFSFLLNFISYLGGPLFIKIFQIFSNFYKFHSEDKFKGSISTITINKNIVTKKLKKNIKNDLNKSLIFFKKYLDFYRISYPFIYEEFYEINLNQLNLNLEMEYSKKLKKLFDRIHKVKVINIFESNNDYNKSELITGKQIDFFLNNEENKKYSIEIFSLLYLSYYLMVANNLFHCDWHFGNFLVNLDEEKNLFLYILDTGLMGSLENSIHQKLKVLLKTDLLRPQPHNILKFLCSINIGKEADVKQFIKMSKNEMKNFNNEKDYNKIILRLLKLSSKYKLKFSVIIIYMFQAIIFLNNTDDDLVKNLPEFSDKFGFSKEILKCLI